MHPSNLDEELTDVSNRPKFGRLRRCHTMCCWSDKWYASGISLSARSFLFFRSDKSGVPYALVLGRTIIATLGQPLAIDHSAPAWAAFDPGTRGDQRAWHSLAFLLDLTVCISQEVEVMGGRGRRIRGANPAFYRGKPKRMTPSTLAKAAVWIQCVVCALLPGWIQWWRWQD